MERFLIWGYMVYQTFKKWYYTTETVSYYMITEEGKQIPIFHDCDEPIWGFLTVYNSNYNYKCKYIYIWCLSSSFFHLKSLNFLSYFNSRKGLY